MKKKLVFIVILIVILASSLAVALLAENKYEEGVETTDYAAVPEFECVVAPAYETNPVGTQHHVFVTVTQNGIPVPGTYVRFVVIGVNTHIGPFRTTNEIGQTDYIYASNGNQGKDIIFAVGGIHQGGNSFFCHALKRWI